MTKCELILWVSKCCIFVHKLSCLTRFAKALCHEKKKDNVLFIVLMAKLQYNTHRVEFISFLYKLSEFVVRVKILIQKLRLFIRYYSVWSFIASMNTNFYYTIKLSNLLNVLLYVFNGYMSKL